MVGVSYRTDSISVFFEVSGTHRSLIRVGCWQGQMYIRDNQSGSVCVRATHSDAGGGGHADIYMPACVCDTHTHAGGGGHVDI